MKKFKEIVIDELYRTIESGASHGADSGHEIYIDRLLTRVRDEAAREIDVIFAAIDEDDVVPKGSVGELRKIVRMEILDFDTDIGEALNDALEHGRF